MLESSLLQVAKCIWLRVHMHDDDGVVVIMVLLVCVCVVCCVVI